MKERVWGDLANIQSQFTQRGAKGRQPSSGAHLMIDRGWKYQVLGRREGKWLKQGAKIKVMPSKPAGQAEVTELARKERVRLMSWHGVDRIGGGGSYRS